MKINGTFFVHEIGGDYILVPGAKSSFNGICALNETGAFIWSQLATDTTEEELVSVVCDRYNVERERAKSDLDAFLERLCAINIIERDGVPVRDDGK